MAFNTGFLDRHFELTTNINATALDRAIGRNGGSLDYFTGNFEGNGFAITIDINTPSQHNVGLFGTIGPGGLVNNLEVRGNVSGNQHVGGIAGTVRNTGAVTNSSSFVAASGNQNVGGVAGFVDSGGNVQFSFATGNINGNQRVGGLVGLNMGAIQNSYATGAIDGNHRIGGVVGENNGGAIQFVYATGRVTGNNNVGGLVGDMNGGALSNSVALNGNIDGFSQIGRITGNPGGAMNFNRARDNMMVEGNLITSGDASSMQGEDLPLATVVPLFWNLLGWTSGIWNVAASGVPYLINAPGGLSSQNPFFPPVVTMGTFSFAGFGGAIVVPGGSDAAPGMLPPPDNGPSEDDYDPDMKLPEEEEYPDEDEYEDDDEESDTGDSDDDDEGSGDNSDGSDDGSDSDNDGSVGPGDENDEGGIETPPTPESPEAEGGLSEPEGLAEGFMESIMESFSEELSYDSENDETATIRNILWKNS